MCRGESRSPPAVLGGEVVGGCGGRVAGVSILDQEDPLQGAVFMPEAAQSLDVMGRVLHRRTHCLHASAVGRQKHQRVDRAVADVLELLPLDQPRNRPTNWMALQSLQVRHLIDTDDPNAVLCQRLSMGIAPQDRRRPGQKLLIQSGRLPVARAMRLQIDFLKNTPNLPGADAGHDAVKHGLASQIGARPMGDVQAAGNGLKAGQFNNLSPLEGGESRGGVPRREASQNNCDGPPRA